MLGIAEGDLSGGLAAEDDHVGEVASPLLDVGLISWALTEDTAGGENLLDGAVDELRCRKAKVTSIVLRVMSVHGLN